MSEPIRGPSGGGWLSRLFGGESAPKLTKEQKTALKALETQKKDLLAQVKPLSMRIKSLSDKLGRLEDSDDSEIEKQLQEMKGALVKITQQIRKIDAQITISSRGPSVEMGSMTETKAGDAAAAASSTDVAEMSIPAEVTLALNELRDPFSKDQLPTYYALKTFQKKYPYHPFTTTIIEKLTSIPEEQLRKAIGSSLMDYYMLNKASGERERDVNATHYAAAHLALEDPKLRHEGFGKTTVSALANEIIALYKRKFGESL